MAQNGASHPTNFSYNQTLGWVEAGVAKLEVITAFVIWPEGVRCDFENRDPVFYSWTSQRASVQECWDRARVDPAHVPDWLLFGVCRICRLTGCLVNNFHFRFFQIPKRTGKGLTFSLYGDQPP